MMLKSTLRNALLFPVWVSIAISISCAYWSFKFDSQAKTKMAKFGPVEQRLSSIDCKEIDTDAVASITRQAFESPRDVAEVFKIFSILMLVTGFANLACAWKYLKIKPAEE